MDRARAEWVLAYLLDTMGTVWVGETLKAAFLDLRSPELLRLIDEEFNRRLKGHNVGVGEKKSDVPLASLRVVEYELRNELLREQIKGQRLTNERLPYRTHPPSK